MTWLALIAKPQMEPDVNADLLQQGFTCWLPMALVERRHARMMEVLTVALYTGYVLLNLQEGEALSAALARPNVVNVMRGMLGMPSPISEREITRVQLGLAGTGGIKDLRPRTITEHLADGRPLRIKLAGPGVDQAAARRTVTRALDIRRDRAHSVAPEPAVKRCA